MPNRYCAAASSSGPGRRIAATRREFVVAVLAGFASATLPRLAARAAPLSPSSTDLDLALGIQSFSLRRYDLEPMLDVLASLGVRQVELFPELEILFYRLGSHFPVTDDGAAIDRVVRAAASRGISIAASGVHSISTLDEAKRLFDFAERAGIPLLTISPDDGVLDGLDRLCAERPRVCLGIHNHGPFSRYDKITDLEAALAGRAPNFGACVDTGHFIRSGEDPVAAVRRLGARVQGIHLKDFEGPGFFAAGCLLGEGMLDLIGLFRGLREIGFGPDRALSLELERDSEALLGEMGTGLAKAREAIVATRMAGPLAGRP